MSNKNNQQHGHPNSNHHGGHHSYNQSSSYGRGGYGPSGGPGGGNQASGGGPQGYHGSAGSYHGGGGYHHGVSNRGYHSGSGSRNKHNMQSQRQHTNQGYSQYAGNSHNQNIGVGGGPAGNSSQAMGSSPYGGNFTKSSHQLSYENESHNLPKSSGGGSGKVNDRQDRAGANSGGYGGGSAHYQGMSQAAIGGGSYGQNQSHHGSGHHHGGFHQSHHSSGGGYQQQKFKNRDNKHDRGGGGANQGVSHGSYHGGKNFGNQGYHYSNNQMSSGATPRNQMYGNFQVDFGSGSQHQDNQSESNYPTNSNPNNHYQNHSSKNNGHPADIDASSSIQSSSYAAGGHHHQQNKASSDKRLNNNNQGAQNQKHAVNHDYGADQGTMADGGGNRAKANNNSYKNNGNQSHYDQMQQSQQDKYKHFNNQNNALHSRQDHFSNQKQSEAGGHLKRQHQNHSFQNQQQPYRSGGGSMHQGHEKKGFKGAQGGGHQSDQHLSTGSPTNSFNGTETSDTRNNRQVMSQQQMHEESTTGGGSYNGNDRGGSYQHVNHSHHHTNKSITQYNQFGPEGQSDYSIGAGPGDYDPKAFQKTQKMSDIRSNFDDKSTHGGMQPHNQRRGQDFDPRSSGSGNMQMPGSGGGNNASHYYSRNDSSTLHQNNSGQIFHQQKMNHNNYNQSKSSYHGSKQSADFSQNPNGSSSSIQQQPPYSGSQNIYGSHRGQGPGNNNSGSQGKYGGRGGMMALQGAQSIGAGPPNSSGGAKKGSGYNNNRHNTDLDNFQHQSDKKQGGNNYGGSQQQQYHQLPGSQNQAAQQQNIPQKGKKNKHNNNHHMHQQYQQDSFDEFYNDAASQNNNQAANSYQGSALQNNEPPNSSGKQQKQNSQVIHNRGAYKHQSESIINQTTGTSGMDFVSSGPIQEVNSRNDHAFRNYDAVSSKGHRGGSGTGTHDFSVAMPPPLPPLILANQPQSSFQDSRDSEIHSRQQNFGPLPNKVVQKNSQNIQGRGSSKGNNQQHTKQGIQAQHSSQQCSTQAFKQKYNQNTNSQGNALTIDSGPGSFGGGVIASNEAQVHGKGMQGYQNMGSIPHASEQHAQSMNSSCQNQPHHDSGNTRSSDKQAVVNGIIAATSQVLQQDNPQLNQTPNFYPTAFMASSSPTAYSNKFPEFQQQKQPAIGPPPLPQFCQGNNVFLQQNFNQQVYITDNHFYQTGLIPGASQQMDINQQSVAGSGPVADLASQLSQAQVNMAHMAPMQPTGLGPQHSQLGGSIGLKDLPNIMASAIPTTTSQPPLPSSASINNCFQTIDGNWEHMEEGCQKEVLVEIEVKLINGDLEKIKITEAKDAKLPLNFFDIQLQIKERLRQLKSMLLVPTLTQRKQAAEKAINKLEGPEQSAEKAKRQKIDSSEKIKQESEQISSDKLAENVNSKSGQKKQEETQNDEPNKQQQTNNALSKKHGNQMTAEEKEQEKLYQDLIEALEFFVKRQLQHNLMPKYKLIAQNTHKIQFQQSIKKLQNDQIFYGINKNSNQIPSFNQGPPVQPHGLVVGPPHQAGQFGLISEPTSLHMDQQLLSASQSFGIGIGQPHLLASHSPYNQQQQIGPQVSRVYTPGEGNLGITNQSQHNLTPTQAAESHQDGQQARLFDQLNLGQSNVSTQAGFHRQQGVPLGPYQASNLAQNNYFYSGAQDANKPLNSGQLDYTQVSNFLMNAASGNGLACPVEQPLHPLTQAQQKSPSDLHELGGGNQLAHPVPPGMQSGMMPGAMAPPSQHSSQLAQSKLGLQSKEFHPKKGTNTHNVAQKVSSPEETEYGGSASNTGLAGISQKGRTADQRFHGKGTN